MGSSCCASSDPNSVGGKSMIYLPCCIRSCLLNCINIAEKRKGSPPNTAEVFVVACIDYKFWSTIGWVNAFLQNLYREDLFYADKQFTYWTTSKEGEGKDGYEKFSERFRRLFAGY